MTVADLRTATDVVSTGAELAARDWPRLIALVSHPTACDP